MSTPMQRFDITAELPSGTTLIEASAGTGKTWTVAALVTRYVAEEGLDLDELLVVTFSRAATQELRERVRSGLESAAEALERPSSPHDDALVQHLRRGSQEDVDQRRARLRAALAEFDAATIATIHQFCHLVLRGLGVAGDSDSFAQLAENLDDLRQEVIDDGYLAGRRAGSLTLPYDAARQAAESALSNATAALSPWPPPDVLREKLTFARESRAEYARRKRRAAVLEYDDLLAELRDALRDTTSAARRRMRSRWSVVLVDEFQDTDPVQWEVFERAFGGGALALILIGDPKQAIYGFRGGDVQTYLRASKEARKLSLPTNYRSDGPLVESLGVLLSSVELSPGIVAHPVQPHRAKSRVTTTTPDVDDAALQLRYLPTAPKLIGEARQLVARDAAAEVARLLGGGVTFAGRALAPSDIAVLAHKNADLMRVRDELRALGIPAVLASNDSVLRTQAGSWWLQLLMAMEQPHRPERVRAAVLTPLVGWSVEHLLALGEHGTDEAAAMVREAVAAFTRGGVAAVLDLLRDGGLLARLLARSGGERDITDVEHCAQLLGEKILTGTSGLPSLVAWLRRRSAEDARVTADSRVLRLDSDARAVTLSTIHGSKGLQYPVVLAPYLWDNWVKDDPTPSVIHTDGGRLLSFDEREVNRPEHRAEALGEHLRLCYVAMTRAQSRLVLWWMSSKRNTLASGLHRLLFGQSDTPESLRALLEERAKSPQEDAALTLRALDRSPSADLATATIEAWQSAGAFHAQVFDPDAAVRPVVLPVSDTPLTDHTFDPVRVIDLGWRRTSYSALAAAGEERTLSMAEQTSEPEQEDVGSHDEVDIALPSSTDPALGGHPSPMADLPMGAMFGSLVHAVLEEADLEADDLRREFHDRIVELLVLWPVDLEAGELADALVAVCSTPLGVMAGDVTLRDIPRRQRLPEMDFELPLAGGDVPHRSATLRAMAGHLREILPDDDPLRPYAEVLDTEAFGEQTLRGYLTGSIDLTFTHEGRYFVVDYKTNRLGDPDQPLTLADYTPERLVAAMNHSSYPLQALLYSVVLHRYLRWRLPGYDPEHHLGGVMYLYVRGMAGPQTPRIASAPCGVFAWRPPARLVTALSDVLDGHAERATASQPGKEQA